MCGSAGGTASHTGARQHDARYSVRIGLKCKPKPRIEYPEEVGGVRGDVGVVEERVGDRFADVGHRGEVDHDVNLRCPGELHEQLGDHAGIAEVDIVKRELPEDVNQAQAKSPT